MIDHRDEKRVRSRWRLAPWAQDLYGTVALMILAWAVLYGVLAAFGR